jgi:voltage-gated potassium channel
VRYRREAIVKSEEPVEARGRQAEDEAEHDPARREERRQAVSRWLDPPLTFASLLLLLLTVIQLTTPLPAGREKFLNLAETGIWVFFVVSFGVEVAVSDDRIRFVRRHWLRAVMVVIPFIGFLRIVSVVRFGQWIAYARLLLLSHRTGSPALDILRRRHLGQVGLISVFVVGICAALEYLVESGAPHANIETFGDALWWAGTTLTTIGSQLYPVTTGGKIVALTLMVYAVSVFTYFVASLASVLVGHDNTEQAKDASNEQQGAFYLTGDEAKVLRNVLARMHGTDREHQRKAS